jgi:hypothetical protein
MKWDSAAIVCHGNHKLTIFASESVIDGPLHCLFASASNTPLYFCLEKTNSLPQLRLSAPVAECDFENVRSVLTIYFGVDESRLFKWTRKVLQKNVFLMYDQEIHAIDIDFLTRCMHLLGARIFTKNRGSWSHFVTQCSEGVILVSRTLEERLIEGSESNGIADAIINDETRWRAQSW